VARRKRIKCAIKWEATGNPSKPSSWHGEADGRSYSIEPVRQQQTFDRQGGKIFIITGPDNRMERHGTLTSAKNAACRWHRRR
jgi:predicted RNA polymerase sigma factor